MKSLFYFSIFLLTLTSVKSNDSKVKRKIPKQVCYDLVGCFELGPPWASAKRACGIPQPPSKLTTTITFYAGSSKGQVIYKYPKITIKDIPFLKNQPTYIITHGSNADSKEPWLTDARNGLIQHQNANVIIVDWAHLAKTGFPLNEITMCGSIRTTAHEVTAVIRKLHEEQCLDYSTTHCVGHSNGAHVCGYIGKNLTSQLATIWGLDAGNVLFEGHPKEVRLSSGDAKLVVAIHTHGAPFVPTLAVGFVSPYADVDFYFNGGVQQPGCEVSVAGKLKEESVVKAVKDKADSWLACPHSRAHDVWAEAVYKIDCTFWGHKANSTKSKDLKLAATNTCLEPEDCIPVGYDTEKFAGRGVYAVITSGEPPFCLPENGKKAEDESYVAKVLKFLHLSG